MVTEQPKEDLVENVLTRFSTVNVQDAEAKIIAVFPWATSRESRLTALRTLAAGKSIRAACPRDVQWEPVFAKVQELRETFSSDVVKTSSDAVLAVLAQLEREARKEEASN